MIDREAQQAVVAKILERKRCAGKTFAFDDKHDPNKPITLFFQQSHEGLVLFVVFYTQTCRWLMCDGCNLPSASALAHVEYPHLLRQIDYVFNHPGVNRRRNDVTKVIVSCQGSVLDEQTFSSLALGYLLAQLHIRLVNVRMLTLETRPEYVDEEELFLLSRAVQEGYTPTDIELAIGFEVFDNHLRNRVYRKGLGLRRFRELVTMVARHGFHLKCYFMQKPLPCMTDEFALQDIRNAIDFLSRVADEFGVAINMHLNPTYVADGTHLEEAFRAGKFKPPRLMDVVRAVMHSRDKHISVFVGLDDEGMAIEGGSFIREGDEVVVKKLENFNRTQDHRVLEALL